MPLDNFANGNALNASAAFQQASLLCFLYWNDRESAQELLDEYGGGQIVLWQWDDSSWPASFALLKQGSTYFLVVAGTQGVRHWLQNLGGIVATPYQGQTVFAHSMWLGMWNSMRMQIFQAIDQDLPDLRINVSGHSMGSAVGTFAAISFAESFGVNNVALMGFGTPRCITRGYTGTLPPTFFRICNPADPVQFVPPQNYQMSGGNPRSMGRSNRNLPWWDYGILYALTDDAQLAVSTANNNTQFFPNGLFEGNPLNAHNITLYRDNLARWIAANRPTPQTAAVDSLGQATTSQPPPQNTDISVPQISYVNLATANAIYFAGLGSVITANNIATLQSISTAIGSVQSRSNTNILDIRNSNMASPSGFWTFQANINNGTYGRSTHVVYRGTTDLKDAITQAKNWSYELSNLFGNNATSVAASKKSTASPEVSSCRVSDPKNPNIGQLIGLGGSSYMGWAGSAGNGADVMSTALSMPIKGLNVIDQATVHPSNHLVCGIPDLATQDGVFFGAFAVPTQTTYTASVLRYLNYLTAPQNNLGFMGQSSTEPKQTATGFVTNNAGFTQFTVTAHGYQSGDKIRMSGADITQWSLTGKIVVVDANTLYFSKKFDVEKRLPGVATVQRIQLASKVKLTDFYAFQLPISGAWNPATDVFISKANLGRQILKASFKRSQRRKQ